MNTAQPVWGAYGAHSARGTLTSTGSHYGSWGRSVLLSPAERKKAESQIQRRFGGSTTRADRIEDEFTLAVAQCAATSSPRVEQMCLQAAKQVREQAYQKMAIWDAGTPVRARNKRKAAKEEAERLARREARAVAEDAESSGVSPLLIGGVAIAVLGGAWYFLRKK